MTSPAPDARPPGGGGVASGRERSGSTSLLECNICLDTARDAVVTFCGHLFCWPCLYRWLQNGHSVCPVCKAGVTRESVIPLFGRGSAASARAGEPGGGGAGGSEGGSGSGDGSGLVHV